MANLETATFAAGCFWHAEAARITFNPSIVSYIGTQYRSVIFFHNKEQERIAKESKEALEKSGKFAKPIVTETVPASAFYKAEEYHQQYLHKRGLSACP